MHFNSNTFSYDRLIIVGQLGIRMCLTTVAVENKERVSSRPMNQNSWQSSLAKVQLFFVELQWFFGC